MEIRPLSWDFLRILWPSGDSNICGNSVTTVKLSIGLVRAHRTRGLKIQQPFRGIDDHLPGGKIDLLDDFFDRRNKMLFKSAIYDIQFPAWRRPSSSDDPDSLSFGIENLQA